MSVEHDVIIPDYEMLEIEYINTDGTVTVFSSIFNEDIMSEPMGSNIVVNSSIYEPVVRIQKSYDKYKVLPLYYSLGDPDSTEVGFSREQREWECIMTFGNNAQTPRKQPTELIYRAKKMKNPFPVD